MSPDHLPLPPDRIPPRGDRPHTVQTAPTLPLIARLVGGIAMIFVIGALATLEERPIEIPLGANHVRSEAGPEPLDVCTRVDELVDAASETRLPGTLGSALRDLVPEDPGIPSADRRLGQRIRDAADLHRGPDWTAELDRDGFVRGYVEAWSLVGGASASIWVYEFEDADGAFAFERFAVFEESCPSSHDVFTVDGVAGGTGLQIWWSDGSQSEQVSFVRGSRRFLANVRGAGIPERALIVALATAADRAAG